MTEELHKKIKRRDDCEYQKCGFKAPDYAYGRLESHHIVPSAEGGADEMGNLVTLCPRCHDYAPDSWRIEDYDRMMEIYLGTDMPPEADLAYFGVLLADRRSLSSGEPVSDSGGWRDVAKGYRDGIVAAENTHRMDGGSW